MTLLLALVLVARAADHAVVGAGDTVESIAAALGDPGLAGHIRRDNGLAEGAQPVVGTVLVLPGGDDHVHSDGLLLALSGTGRLEEPGQAPTALAEAQVLPEGSTVCTDEDSYATVRLAVRAGRVEHDDITLLERTCVTIERAGSGGGRRASLVALRTGSLSVRETEDPGVVTVRTEASVTTGDHGGWRVTTEEGAARTEATRHPVRVMGSGVQVDLAAGQGSRVVVGRPPSPPVPLLPAGTPVRPLEGTRLRRPDFAWTPVERALGYRVQVAVDADFAALVQVEEVPGPAWVPDLLFLPYRVPGLWWRVASFDRTGFLGPWCEAQRLDFPVGVGP